MRKYYSLALFVALLLLTFAPLPVLAQMPAAGLKISLRKEYGYNNFDGSIQGAFSLSAQGPAELSRVTYAMDAQEMGQVSAPPFRLLFNTDAYALGAHAISAVGLTTDGRELRSNTIHVKIVPESEGPQMVLKMMAPLLGVVFGSMLLAGLLVGLTQRGKTVDLAAGAPRRYGLLGGAVCPKCSRPFSLHLWAPHLGFSRLDRCPYCGHWGLARRQPASVLKAAEAAELAAAQPLPLPQAEEELRRKQIDETRYDS